MTTLEQVVLRPGYRTGLLCVHYEPHRDLAAWERVEFEGGAETARECFGPAPVDGQAHLALRPHLARFLAGGAPLAACGPGWSRFLAEALPEQIEHLPLLDLRACAILLANLPARAGRQALAKAYHVAYQDSEEAMSTAFWEELFWRVLHVASQRGLDWEALRALPETRILSPAFQQYHFDAETLATIPPVPGVYLMHDADGSVIYVGKAANLQRRLADYFRNTLALSDKLRTIRDRIHDLTLHPVGSELEALLLEHRLIETHDPDVNRQRRISEGRGRYGTPPFPLVIFTSSSRRSRVDLFFLAPDRSVVQHRINPPRPPRTHLKKLIEYSRGQAPLRMKTTTCEDWGCVGLEIASRYFARYRSRLQWMELGGNDTESLVRAVVDCAQTFQAGDPEAVEFRNDPSSSI